jgi:Domain of unknown function (DUF4375)
MFSVFCVTYRVDCLLVVRKKSGGWMRFKIDRKDVVAMDTSVLVEVLASEIRENFRLPSRSKLNAYSANRRLSRAQVNIYIVGEAVAEVLNGGLFQLIMNSAGTFLPDLPGAFRDLKRVREGKIIEEVCEMFPDMAVLRVRSSRMKFASKAIVPGGWEGVVSGRETVLSRRLDRLEDKFTALVQSPSFFRAVARYVKNEADSFEVVSVNARTSR